MDDRSASIDATDPRLGERVRAVFDQGRLLALPTETVYGLAAPIDRPDLIARVFELKGRPPDNPLIVHVGSLGQARRVVSEWPEAAETLAGSYWPGPLTLVLRRSELISDAITAGRDTVAVRMPEHPVALAVLQALDVPLVAPSANLFTRLSPTCAADVRAAFPADLVEIIDGGPCRVGIESTIVAVEADQRRLVWLRPGMLDRDAISACLPQGWRLEIPVSSEDTPGARPAPGRMREHYRPRRPLHVRVYRDSVERARLLSCHQTDIARQVVELPDGAEQAARRLYRLLHQADQADPDSRLPIELLLPAARLTDPAWEGVVNRLAKAATRWVDPAVPN